MLPRWAGMPILNCLLLSAASSPTPPRNLARAPGKLSRPVVRKQSTQPVILPICKTQLVTQYGQEGWCTVLSYSGSQLASHINCGTCYTTSLGSKFEALCRAENSFQAYQTMQPNQNTWVAAEPNLQLRLQWHWNRELSQHDTTKGK